MSLRAKLRNNADWFSDEHARKDYFMKVVADESWEIAEPYFQDDTATVDNILEALDYRWADPMEKQTARSNYQSYLQLNKPFAEFIAKFQTLARMAEIPKAIQIDDLRAKVNFDLQNQAASYEPKDLNDFITYLQRTARNLEQVKQQRQRVTARRNRGGGNAGGNSQRPRTNGKFKLIKLLRPIRKHTEQLRKRVPQLRKEGSFLSPMHGTSSTRMR